jgi:hypothetical protein
MTTSDKSPGADKSVQHVVNMMPAVAKEQVTQPAAQKTTLRARARSAQIEREDASLDVPDLSKKTQEQDVFEADAANVQNSTSVAWEPASPMAPVPDALFAQAASTEGTRTASDAAGANSWS